MAFQKVVTLDDLWRGEMKGFVVEGRHLLLVNYDGTVHAYSDVCPHQRSSLGAGTLSGNVLTCATHHWQFDVSSGRGINPERACLEAFAVRIDNGDILVDVDQLPT